MNKENASKLWKMIQEAGDYLLGQRDTMVDLGSQQLCGQFKIHKKLINANKQ